MTPSAARAPSVFEEAVETSNWHQVRRFTVGGPRRLMAQKRAKPCPPRCVRGSARTIVAVTAHCVLGRGCVMETPAQMDPVLIDKNGVAYRLISDWLAS